MPTFRPQTFTVLKKYKICASYYSYSNYLVCTSVDGLVYDHYTISRYDRELFCTCDFDLAVFSQSSLVANHVVIIFQFRQRPSSAVSTTFECYSAHNADKIVIPYLLEMIVSCHPRNFRLSAPSPLRPKNKPKILSGSSSPQRKCPKFFKYEHRSIRVCNNTEEVSNRSPERLLKITYFANPSRWIMAPILIRRIGGRPPFPSLFYRMRPVR